MKTVLYNKHIEVNARMVPFASWEMPIQYEGIIKEHAQTRTRCSIFDTCHMGEFDIQGPAAETDLETLLTLSVSTLQNGQCRYGFLLNKEGGILDDLMCYRRGPDHFFLVVNAGTLEKDAAWIREHLSSSTTFTDLSSHTAKLDVQGPISRKEIETIFRIQLPELNYFRFTDLNLAEVPCTISRTGYTGEWGYELYFPTNDAERIWDLLTVNGSIKPAGLGARDTLRLEAGYALYGSELSENRTPVAASRGLFIDMKKEFIGKEIMAKDLREGIDQFLVGLQLETRRSARVGSKVMHQKQVVGEVTSGSFSPTLGFAIALAYVRSDLIDPGQKLDIETQKTRLAAEVVELPFYKKGTARKKSV
ncbi:MAG: glycine cleavage system aminomethyltransferase GcvT [Kiritimatiellae bacterium]|nr:glycine cleavage system aminomethyltransferase GcvT [Kiritimatiellia bacterium]